MKRVAIIIPTYNRWPIVKSAIDSALGQKYENCSCIVVDDASTDNTAEMLTQEYQKKINFIRMKQNSGQSICKNIGVEATDADFVCFLDSDDILYPDAVSSRLSVIEEINYKKSQAAFGIFITPKNKAKKLIGAKKRGEKLSISEYIRNKSWCNNNGFLVNKNIFLKAGGYNPKLRDKEDIELILRLMSLTNFHYSGSKIGEVRNICAGKRQRERYDLIIAQKYLFSDAIKSNSHLMSLLSKEDFSILLSDEVEGLLSALYKDRQYSKFRSHYIDALKKNELKRRFTFFKRYLLSYALDFFSENASKT